MKKKIKVTSLYQETVEAAQNNQIICHEGGSRSSKTWSIFQFFLAQAIQGEELTITIVRDKLTWIKSTLLKDFEELVKKMELKVTPNINPNRAEQIYNINGTEFAFFGLDYSEKLHGRRQDWFWVNEAMEVAQKHFDQLEMRTQIGGILDYNPYDDMHWIFDLQKRDDVAVIKSTMRNNPFLPPAVIKKIESYEPTPENIRQGTADNYMWQVYGLGEKARLEGVIFENWQEVDEIPEGAKLLGYGLDFGYTNDPTAMVALYRYNQELYLDEILYETGLTNQDIVKRLEQMEISKTTLIIGDSAEPKSIEEIKRAGYAIKGSRKGSDSIRYGIDLLLSHKLNITRRSENLKNEKRKYKWAEDRQGRRLQVPVDDFNHLIDAERYIASHCLGRSHEIQIIGRDRLGI
jgi:phage terminase large subunit